MFRRSEFARNSIRLAITSLLISTGEFVSAAEFGIGSTISSNTEIVFPIRVGDGDWQIQPLVTHRENESSTGVSQFTGLYVNTQKRIGSYEKVSLYAGLEIGAGNGDNSAYRLDVLTNTLQVSQRTYREILVKPNIEAIYSVAKNLEIGGQFGLAFWDVQYDFDAYSPTPASVPSELSTATRAVIFVKYFFRD